MNNLVAQLESADDRCRDARASIEDRGEDTVESVAETYREFERLMERYQERATDWDDFEGYVEFQEKVVDLVESLPEEFPEREAFEEADDIFHQRNLSDADFERAREALAPAREHVELLDEWDEARTAYRDARSDIQHRKSELESEIDELERLQRLGDADLDAPTDRLRDPIEAYNDRISEAFRTLKREQPARECLDVVSAADAFPLVDYKSPPDRLQSFVESAPVGEEPIPQLLDYAEYSNSKLDHYVERPQELKRHVATNRTYLDRLDAGPLTVDWPPPEATELRWRCREYLSMASRFASEETLTALRDVRALADREEYERLRTAATARTELTDAERERIETEDIERQLENARDERDRLAEALSEYPSR